MNGLDAVIDTNVVIYILEGNPKFESITELNLALSSITEIELLGRKGIQAHEIKTIKSFLQDCLVVELTPAIKDIAIKIKQSHKVKLPDAVIVATANHLNLPLITADKGFNELDDKNIFIIDL
jgi:hypothetical protein